MKLLINNKLLPFIWTACVFYLLSFDTTGASDSAIWKVPGIDKLIHFIIFLIFSYLWGVFFLQHSQFDEKTIIISIIIFGSGCSRYNSRYLLGKKKPLWT